MDLRKPLPFRGSRFRLDKEHVTFQRSLEIVCLSLDLNESWVASEHVDVGMLLGPSIYDIHKKIRFLTPLPVHMGRTPLVDVHTRSTTRNTHRPLETASTMTSWT